MKIGIKRNGVFIGAMNVPGRKKPCLVVERREGSGIVIGTFNNEAAVASFESALQQLMERRASDD